MAFALSKGAVSVGVATLATLISPESAYAFGVGPGPAATTGHVQNLRHVGAASSFVLPRPEGASGRTRACSTTLASSYVVKPEMARPRGSKWRKLRTRGPGFGEKVGCCFCG